MQKAQQDQQAGLESHQRAVVATASAVSQAKGIKAELEELRQKQLAKNMSQSFSSSMDLDNVVVMTADEFYSNQKKLDQQRRQRQLESIAALHRYRDGRKRTTTTAAAIELDLPSKYTTVTEMIDFFQQWDDMDVEWRNAQHAKWMHQMQQQTSDADDGDSSTNNIDPLLLSFSHCSTEKLLAMQASLERTLEEAKLVPLPEDEVFLTAEEIFNAFKQEMEQLTGIVLPTMYYSVDDSDASRLNYETSKQEMNQRIIVDARDDTDHSPFLETPIASNRKVADHSSLVTPIPCNQKKFDLTYNFGNMGDDDGHAVGKILPDDCASIESNLHVNQALHMLSDDYSVYTSATHDQVVESALNLCSSSSHKKSDEFLVEQALALCGDDSSSEGDAAAVQLALGLLSCSDDDYTICTSVESSMIGDVSLDYIENEQFSTPYLSKSPKIAANSGKVTSPDNSGLSKNRANDAIASKALPNFLSCDASSETRPKSQVQFKENKGTPISSLSHSGLLPSSQHDDDEEEKMHVVTTLLVSSQVDLPDLAPASPDSVCSLMANCFPETDTVSTTISDPARPSKVHESVHESNMDNELTVGAFIKESNMDSESTTSLPQFEDPIALSVLTHVIACATGQSQESNQVQSEFEQKNPTLDSSVFINDTADISGAEDRVLTVLAANSNSIHVVANESCEETISMRLNTMEQEREQKSAPSTNLIQGTVSASPLSYEMVSVTNVGVVHDDSIVASPIVPETCTYSVANTERQSPVLSTFTIVNDTASPPLLEETYSDSIHVVADESSEETISMRLNTVEQEHEHDPSTDLTQGAVSASPLSYEMVSGTNACAVHDDSTVASPIVLETCTYSVANTETQSPVLSTFTVVTDTASPPLLEETYSDSINVVADESSEETISMRLNTMEQEQEHAPSTNLIQGTVSASPLSYEMVSGTNACAVHDDSTVASPIVLETCTYSVANTESQSPVLSTFTVVNDTASPPLLEETYSDSIHVVADESSEETISMRLNAMEQEHEDAFAELQLVSELFISQSYTKTTVETASLESAEDEINGSEGRPCVKPTNVLLDHDEHEELLSDKDQLANFDNLTAIIYPIDVDSLLEKETAETEPAVWSSAAIDYLYPPLLKGICNNLASDEDVDRISVTESSLVELVANGETALVSATSTTTSYAETAIVEVSLGFQGLELCPTFKPTNDFLDHNESGTLMKLSRNVKTFTGKATPMTEPTVLSTTARVIDASYPPLVEETCNTLLSDNDIDTIFAAQSNEINEIVEAFVNDTIAESEIESATLIAPSYAATTIEEAPLELSQVESIHAKSSTWRPSAKSNDEILDHFNSVSLMEVREANFNDLKKMDTSMGKETQVTETLLSTDLVPRVFEDTSITLVDTMSVAPINGIIFIDEAVTNDNIGWSALVSDVFTSLSYELADSSVAKGSAWSLSTNPTREVVDHDESNALTIVQDNSVHNLAGIIDPIEGDTSIGQETSRTEPTILGIVAIDTDTLHPSCSEEIYTTYSPDKNIYTIPVAESNETTEIVEAVANDAIVEPAIISKTLISPSYDMTTIEKAPLEVPLESTDTISAAWCPSAKSANEILDRDYSREDHFDDSTTTLDPIDTNASTSKENLVGGDFTNLSEASTYLHPLKRIPQEVLPLESPVTMDSTCLCADESKAAPIGQEGSSKFESSTDQIESSTKASTTNPRDECYISTEYTFESISKGEHTTNTVKSVLEQDNVMKPDEITHESAQVYLESGASSRFSFYSPETDFVSELLLYDTQSGFDKNVIVESHNSLGESCLPDLAVGDENAHPNDENQMYCNDMLAPNPDLETNNECNNVMEILTGSLGAEVAIDVGEVAAAGMPNDEEVIGICESNDTTDSAIFSKEPDEEIESSTTDASQEDNKYGFTSEKDLSQRLSHSPAKPKQLATNANHLKQDTSESVADCSLCGCGFLLGIFSRRG